jgi:hypothetical protein
MTKTSVFKIFNPSIGTKLMRKYNKGETALLPDTDVPSLALLRAAYGTDIVTELLKIHIRDLFDYVEQEQGSNDARIRELAELILANYYDLNIAEFIYFCSECKLARYGIFYGKSGTHQLAAMLQAYIRERNREIDIIERKNTEQRIQSQCNGYRAYIEHLQQQADNGNEEARQLLTKHRQIYGNKKDIL